MSQVPENEWSLWWASPRWLRNADLLALRRYSGINQETKIIFEENYALGNIYSTRQMLELLESSELQTLVEQIIPREESSTAE